MVLADSAYGTARIIAVEIFNPTDTRRLKISHCLAEFRMDTLKDRKALAKDRKEPVQDRKEPAKDRKEPANDRKEPVEDSKKSVKGIQDQVEDKEPAEVGKKSAEDIKDPVEILKKALSDIDNLSKAFIKGLPKDKRKAVNDILKTLKQWKVHSKFTPFLTFGSTPPVV